MLALFVLDFEGHNYWPTALFCVAMTTDWFDGRLARRSGRNLCGVFAGWMVALIVARELLVSGLRLAAIERGVVLEARDLGKLKTWASACRGHRRPRRVRRVG